MFTLCFVFAFALYSMASQTPAVVICIESKIHLLLSCLVIKLSFNLVMIKTNELSYNELYVISSQMAALIKLKLMQKSFHKLTVGNMLDFIFID